MSWSFIVHKKKKGDLWAILPDPETLVELIVRTTRFMETLKKKPTLKIADNFPSFTGKGNANLKFEEDSTIPELIFKKGAGKEDAICAIPAGSA